VLSLHPPVASEKVAKLVQKLGQLPPFGGCIPTGMYGPTCVFWASLTPFARKMAEASPGIAYRGLMGYDGGAAETAQVGLGRIIALYNRSYTSYQIC
jgi:hypothetical protein